MAMFECFVCGKKIGFLQDMAETSDHKYICVKDTATLLNDSSITSTIPFSVKRKIKKLSSADLMSMNNPVVAEKESKGLLCCPYCGSSNINALGADKKKFSVGKAVGGAVLTGGVGALAGFLGKKTGKTNFVCLNCGKQFNK